MKLYYSPGACSLAAHIIADEGHLTLQLEKVDLKSHKTENGQDYYEVNPKGYVPAIQLDDGSMLTENVAVLQYMGELADGHFVPPAGTMDRYHLEEWLGFITAELHKSFAPLFRGGTALEKIHAKENLLERLAYVDDELKGKPFLMGDRMTVADAYLFVMLTWARKVKLDVKRYSNLSEFFDRMSRREGVKRAMREEGLPVNDEDLPRAA